jgi:hypothetical protein
MKWAIFADLSALSIVTFHSPEREKGALFEVWA